MRSNEFREVKRLRLILKNFWGHQELYLQFFPGARIVRDRLLVHCPIPSHGHSGHGKAGLSIDLTRGLFHCFSRDDGGDVFKFYMLMKDISFMEAAREIYAQVDNQPEPSSKAPILESRVNVQDPPVRPSDNQTFVEICTRFLALCANEDQSEGRRYLIDRGISDTAINITGIRYFPVCSYGRVMDEMLKHFHLDDLQRSGIFNEAGKLTFYRHRLLFPFFSAGQVCYIQARSISDETNSRWHNLRGSVPSFFNGDSLDEIPSGSTVFLVEGITDTLTLITHHFHAVGIIGASGLKEEWLGGLGRFLVVSVLDSDPAGDTATKRYQAMFAARGKALARIRLPLDINDYFKSHPTAAIELSLLAETAIENSRQNWRRHDSETVARRFEPLFFAPDPTEITQKIRFN